MPTFLRRNAKRHSGLGKRRKKKQKWRYPTGRHNKMREKRRGYPITVSVGYQNDKKIKGNLEGKNPIIINNVKDLEKLTKQQIGVIARLGKKKKLVISEKAKEKGILLYNINPQQYLKKNKKKDKKDETNKENKK
jgi:ribosomal protein L32E